MTARPVDEAGADMIAAERQRQIADEGWGGEHDDEHVGGQLALAARCYLAEAARLIEGRGRMARPAPIWPWSYAWWKPSADPVRNLVKAGALIAAEIDRLQRTTP